MLQDLKDSTTTVLEKTLKWQTIFANDSEFIYSLCQQLIDQDKFYAIPHVLALSSYKHHFEELEQIRFKPHQLKLKFNNQEEESKPIQLKSFENPIYKDVDSTDFGPEMKKYVLLYGYSFHEYRRTYAPVFVKIRERYTSLYTLSVDGEVLLSGLDDI